MSKQSEVLRQTSNEKRCGGKGERCRMDLESS